MALGKNLKKRHSSVAPSTAVVEELVEEPSSIPKDEVVVAGPELDMADEDVVSYKLMCVFGTGGEEYAIPIDDVKEVVKSPSIAPVPQMPDYITGMVNVRGNIYAVLDLATFFNNKADVDENFNFLVVINDEEHKLAIRIPNVPDTLHVPDDMVENFSASMLKSIKKQEFLIGIIKKDKRMIILLNILDMISSENFALQLS